MSGALISQAAYARRVGISAQLLAHHIKVGNVQTHGELRKINYVEADESLQGVIKKANIPSPAASASEPAPQSPSGDKILTLHEARAERARQDAARAKLAKEKEAIELGLLQGAIVMAADVEREWSGLLSVLRSRLISIPSKIAARAAAENSPQIVQSLLDAEIRMALEELSGSDGIGDGRQSDKGSRLRRRAKAASKAGR